MYFVIYVRFNVVFILPNISRFFKHVDNIIIIGTGFMIDTGSNNFKHLRQCIFYKMMPIYNFNKQILPLDIEL